MVDPAKIRSNYLRGMFIPDALSTIPFDRIALILMVVSGNNNGGSSNLR